MPPRKRPRQTFNEGTGDPDSPNNSPVVGTPSDRGGGSADPAAQPSGGDTVTDVADNHTNVNMHRTRQASERRDSRAEDGSAAPHPDVAVFGSSQPLDGDSHPRRVVPPNQPAASFTIAALRERGRSMLIGDGERPRASGDAHKASAATLELILAVQMASKVVADWKEQHIEALSAAFGNFDRVVARGAACTDGPASGAMPDGGGEAAQRPRVPGGARRVDLFNGLSCARAQRAGTARLRVLRAAARRSLRLPAPRGAGQLGRWRLEGSRLEPRVAGRLPRAPPSRRFDATLRSGALSGHRYLFGTSNVDQPPQRDVPHHGRPCQGRRRRCRGQEGQWRGLPRRHGACGHGSPEATFRCVGLSVRRAVGSFGSKRV